MAKLALVEINFMGEPGKTTPCIDQRIVYVNRIKYNHPTLWEEGINFPSSCLPCQSLSVATLLARVVAASNTGLSGHDDARKESNTHQPGNIHQKRDKPD